MSEIGPKSAKMSDIGPKSVKMSDNFLDLKIPNFFRHFGVLTSR